MTPFERLPFSDVLSDASAGSPKIQQSAYLESGRYPIVDQGQGAIAGFTNDEAMLSRADLPVLVFGDHTRRFKYIDQPFAIGADGVKLLRTSAAINAKFAYWYLSSIAIPNAGYSRHFKFLKDLTIPVPPLVEQRRIAGILDRADELRDKRRRALTLLDELAKSELSRFLSRSSGPRRPVVLLAEVADVQTGPFGSLLHREDYHAGGIPLVNPMHIANGRVNANPEYAISEPKFAELGNFALHVDDVVLGRRGEMGRAAVVHESDGPLICGTGSMILRPKRGKMLGEVLVQLVSSPAVRSSLEQRAQGVTMLNLNQAIVGATPLPLPSYEDQRAYVNATRVLDSIRAAHRRHLGALDELFETLQQLAFVGQL